MFCELLSWPTCHWGWGQRPGWVCAGCPQIPSPSACPVAPENLETHVKAERKINSIIYQYRQTSKVPFQLCANGKWPRSIKGKNGFVISLSIYCTIILNWAGGFSQPLSRCSHIITNFKISNLSCADLCGRNHCWPLLELKNGRKTNYLCFWIFRTLQ